MTNGNAYANGYRTVSAVSGQKCCVCAWSFQRAGKRRRFGCEYWRQSVAADARCDVFAARAPTPANPGAADE